MQETTDGVVIGRIKPKGELERLGEKGKVICTYFEDDDGNWIRDYGGEFDLAQAASSATPAIADGKTAECDKAAEMMERAGRIVDKSKRSSEKARAEIDAIDASGCDYATRLDRKIDALMRAVSGKARIIMSVAGILVELKRTQAKDTTGEAQSIELKDMLAQLKKERNDLLGQLEEVQKEQNIHSHKGRDPTEANFKFLWNEGQVASIEKSISRQKNPARENDWLERYTISLKPGPQGERYAPWIVHAHFDSGASDATPARVHMKRDAEKDWGVNMKPYRSLPLSMGTFDLVKQKVQKQQTASTKRCRYRQGRLRVWPRPEGSQELVGRCDPRQCLVPVNGGAAQ